MSGHCSRLPCLPLWSCHGMVALRWVIIIKITNVPSYKLLLILILVIKILVMNDSFDHQILVIFMIKIVMMIVMIVVRSKMMIRVMMVITRFWPSDDGDDRVDEGLVRFKGAEVGGITFLTKVHEGEIVTSH